MLADRVRVALGTGTVQKPVGTTSRSGWLLAVAVGLPILVAIASLAGQSWWATSDRALELIQIRAVGTADTPLVGPWSRYGWNHPGPLLFWLTAPAEAVAGSLGVLATVGVVNLAAAVTAVLAAHRAGGPRLALLIAAAVAVFIHSGGNTVIVDPWNPYVIALPLVAFLVCAWAAATAGAGWCLIVAVLMGSFAAQAHVGAVPIVATGAVAAALAYWAQRGHRESVPLSRGVLITGTVAGLATWSGPIIQQLSSGSGNLTQVARFFLGGQSSDEPLAFDTAMGLAGRELGMPAAWMGVTEAGTDELLIPGEAWTVAALGVALVGVVLGTHRCRQRHASAFAATGLVLVAVSVLSIITVGEFTAAYLFRSSWAAGLVGWTALAWGAGLAIPTSALDTRALGRWVDRGSAVIVTVILVTATVASLVDTTPVTPPAPEFSEATGALSAQATRTLAPGRYGLRWNDTGSFGATALGVGTELLDDGYNIVFPEHVDANVNPDLSREPGTPAPPILLVDGPFTTEGPTRPEGAELIASYDPLSSREQRRVATLKSRIRTSLPAAPVRQLDLTGRQQRSELVARGADPGDVAALAGLRNERQRYVVWLVPP